MKLIKCVLKNSVVNRKVDTAKEVSEVKYRSKKITQNAAQDIRKWKIWKEVKEMEGRMKEERKWERWAFPRMDKK